jgi:hypothetical protein
MIFEIISLQILSAYLDTVIRFEEILAGNGRFSGFFYFGVAPYRAEIKPALAGVASYRSERYLYSFHGYCTKTFPTFHKGLSHFSTTPLLN